MDPTTVSQSGPRTAVAEYDAASSLNIEEMIETLEFYYREREDEFLDPRTVHNRRYQFKEWRDRLVVSYISTLFSYGHHREWRAVPVTAPAP